MKNRTLALLLTGAMLAGALAGCGGGAAESKAPAASQAPPAPPAPDMGGMY